MGEGQSVGKFMAKDGKDQNWNLRETEPCENAICKDLVMLVENHYREDTQLSGSKESKEF